MIKPLISVQSIRNFMYGKTLKLMICSSLRSELMCPRQHYMTLGSGTACAAGSAQTIYSQSSLQWNHGLQHRQAFSEALLIYFMFGFPLIFGRFTFCLWLYQSSQTPPWHVTCTVSHTPTSSHEIPTESRPSKKLRHRRVGQEWVSTL